MARIGIFGASGKGKSWYFGKLLEDVIPDFDYAIHFDLEDEEIGLSMEGNALYRTFYIDEEFFNTTVTEDGREMPLVKAAILRNKKLRIVPDNLTPGERQELFAQISELGMKLAVNTDATVMITADEAHEVVPDIGDSIDERIIRMLTGGRKHGLEWALCTQRPANLHPTAFTQMNYGVYFALTKDNDVMKVNNSTGFNAYERLKQLKEREALIENNDDGSLRKLDTNNLEREYPHFAGDDGVADEALKMGEEQQTA